MVMMMVLRLVHQLDQVLWRWLRLGGRGRGHRLTLPRDRSQIRVNDRRLSSVGATRIIVIIVVVATI